MTGRSNPLPEIYDPDWMNQAACTDLAVSMFFVGQGQDDTPAKQVCADCPVRHDCLEYAIKHRIYYGVWGGTSERQRRKMRRHRRLQAEWDAA